MKCAGLIFDSSFHYIDHLAPLCSMMNWPLIVCDPAVAIECRQFYPNLEVIEMDFFQLSLPRSIVTCDNRALLDLFLPTKYQGKVLWLPHGLSDKGFQVPIFEALEREDLLLVYGEKMRQALAAAKVQIPQISIGNFRWKYYQKTACFYQEYIQKEIGDKRIVLYAPTWEDAEKNGTFWDAFLLLIQNIPKDLFLAIKLHPNTTQKFRAEIERCKAVSGRCSNLIWIENFSPIYPLLDRADFYIGDMSSIGYDFLQFQRPMFFLIKDTNIQNKPLLRCGKQILLKDAATLLQSMKHFLFTPDTKRACVELLQLAFDEKSNFEITLQNIVHEWNAPASH